MPHYTDVPADLEAPGTDPVRPGPVHVIINRTAGAGRAGKLEPRLLSGLADRFGGHYTLSATRGPGDAARLAAAAADQATGLVVAVGGDGTVHEVVNGLLGARQHGGHHRELGIVHCGTGGGLAGSLDLPHGLDDQLDLLISPKRVIIDLGRVWYRDASGRDTERWFVSECQIGIGTVVNAALAPAAKRFGGRLAFGTTALRSVLGHRATSLTVSSNGNPGVSRSLLGLAIGNGNVCAGGMRLTPDARLDDGALDVLAIHDMRLPARLALFPRLYAGTHVGSPHFETHRTRRLSISAEQPVPVSADGEILGFTPCRISLVPLALRVRAGRCERS